MGRPERATPHGVYELRSKIYQPRTKVRSARQSGNVNRKWERVAADGTRMECAKSDRLRKIKKGSWRQLLAVRQDRHFNKEQTPLASLRCQPTVSRWFSRCLEAHLGPLNCKIRFLFALRFAVRGHTTPAASQCSPAQKSVCRRLTSPGCRSTFVHDLGYLWLIPPGFIRENKKPCLLS